MHARRDNAAARVAAAYQAGCRRFDTALGGLGGCPFAQDVLVGNLPTEIAIAELTRLGAVLPQIQSFDSLLSASRSIQAKFGSMPQ
jgi:hydroxymethylglutaryl-CoA lyase